MAIVTFEIKDIKTAPRGNNLYVDVTFYDALNRPFHRNDFVMGIPPTTTIYTGPDLDEGDTINPADIQTVDTDVPATILATIRRYIIRKNLTLTFEPDYRSQALKRAARDTDPLGLRARPGVTELIDSRKMGLR